MMYVDVFARALLGAVFLIAAVSKLRSPAAYSAFRRSVVEIGGPRPGTTAALVGAAETSVPILLLIPATVLVGYAVSIVLLAAFIAAIATVLRRPRGIPCRCFGASGGQLRRDHIVRNLMLVTAAVAGASANLGVGAGGPDAAGLGVAAAAGALLAGVIISWDDLAFAAGWPAKRSARAR